MKVIQSLRVGVYSALLVLAGFALAAILLPTGRSTATDDGLIFDRMQIGGTLIQETERVFSEIYNRTAPGVVSIVVQTSDTAGVGESSGSGFVIDTTGNVVTNYHVVEGGQRIEVYMYDGTITRAEVVGVDPDSDLAVIRINVPSDRLRPIAFGNSDALTVGQTVLALGNPFSNNWTLTTGIVSALNRTRPGFTTFSIGGVIQTDAAINPGNSGGPLLNLNGEVVGVNSQIDGGQRINAGVGFAVPSNLVRRVAQEIIANGRVRYSYLGIRAITPINLDVLERFNLPNNMRGVVIDVATPGDPAALGGVRSQTQSGSVDVIMAIDGKTIRDFDEMIGYLAINTTPGQTITLTVYRDGNVVSVPVTLGERISR